MFSGWVKNLIRAFHKIIITVLHQREHLQARKSVTYLMVMFADNVYFSMLFRRDYPNFEKRKSFFHLIPIWVLFCLKGMNLIVIHCLIMYLNNLVQDFIFSLNSKEKMIVNSDDCGFASIKLHEVVVDEFFELH